jgi:hypothetical protein
MAAEMGDELVSGREIMQDLGKVSKGVLLNFSKNPAALVKAVKQANLLGTTLDKINSAGDNMLDIESSIQKEMEARVITGKDLNLNQARYYAMTGDTEKLQEEITKQMGTAADYEKMMPMQRKALAEALGMTKDEMDEMMVKQKELETLGYDQEKLQEILGGSKADQAKALAALGKTEAKDLLEKKILEQDRVKTTAKLADVMAKLGDLASKFLGPVLSIVDGLISGITFLLTPFQTIASTINSIFTGATSIKDVFTNMGTVLTTFVGTFATLLGLQQAYMAYQERDLIIQTAKDALGKAQVAWETAKNTAAAAYAAIQKGNLLKTIGEAAMKAFASAASVPIVGPLLGAAAAAGAVALGMKYMSDGVIGPDGGMVVSGQKGSISLDPNDSIVAGTNLFGGGTQTNTATNQPAVNDPQIGEMISLLKQLVAATSGPTVIKIGSKTIEELDSQISLRKNYNIGPDRTYGNRL